MKKLILYLTFFSCTFVGFAIEIPPGGTNMINDAIANHSQVGGPGTVTVVNADHQEFDKAIRVDVTSLPQNYWNFQVVFQTNMALEKDDVCLVSLWARTTSSGSEAGEGLLTVIEEHKDTYSKPLSHTFSPGGEWTHLVYAYKANQTLTLDKHKAAIFFGHAVQTIEIAHIQYLNYKNTKTLEELPKMPITYAGMEEDAPWRADAEERIEKFRMGNVQVKLVDANNNPVAEADVTLQMKQHKFGFGSAINAQYYLDNTTYRNHIHELFSEVVFENDLKWKPWPAKASHQYVLNAIDGLHAENIKVRGHCLIWPGWNHMPSYLQLYKDNPPRLRNECIDHIAEAVTLTKGKLVDWDVINEPYTNHDVQDILGEEVMADWFKKVKEIDPDVKKYINDYSILGNGGTDVNHQNHYFETIKFIDEKGGEIDGIGLQSHFKELVTGIPKVLEILDRFAAFNKEIKITEFDINSTNDSLKVNYTRDFMTALFSYPYVKSILSWGFWEGRHWKPDAAMYNLDWSIRPQGEMYKSLVFDKWWTKDQNKISGSNGNLDFGSCFLGTYELTVKSGEKTVKKTVPVHFNKENKITVNIDNETFSTLGAEHPETPVFTSAKEKVVLIQEEISVYPNPAKNQLIIDFQNYEQPEKLIQLFNIFGMKVFEQKVFSENSASLKLPVLREGLYLVSVKSGDKKRVKKVLIKN